MRIAVVLIKLAGYYCNLFKYNFSGKYHVQHRHLYRLALKYDNFIKENAVKISVLIKSEHMVKYFRKKKYVAGC